MLLNRIIPTLLVDGPALVKTKQFKDWKYLGDVINAIRIFNEKQVDEIILLDITATPNCLEPRLSLIQDVAQEAFMPFCYGGGIQTVKQIGDILSRGAEKVAINSALHENNNLISEAASHFGSQSIVASIDVKMMTNGKWGVFSHKGIKERNISPLDLAKRVEDMGAGEILLSDISRDGMKCGYNLELIETISNHVGIPIIACCGASSPKDLKSAMDVGASAVAAGALFTLIGRLDAPLLSYPSVSEMEGLFS
ncbi:MAG: imidazole glycerol phosphate synthase subunit HisF [Alphaproteobacteria bacterium]|nr:imidazole glycerol phosphate synthase subunit HisF [Alphaproteobacteria bacterium]